MGGGKELGMSLVPPKSDHQAILNSVEWFYDLYKDYKDGTLDTSFSMPKEAAEWYVEATINRANILLDELNEHYTTYDTVTLDHGFLDNTHLELEEVFFLMDDIQDQINQLEGEGKLILPYSSVSFVEATTAVVNVSHGLGIQLFAQGDFRAGINQNCANTIPFGSKKVIEMNVFSNFFPTYTAGQFGTYIYSNFMRGVNPVGPYTSNNYCGDIYHVNTDLPQCTNVIPPNRSTLGDEMDCIPSSELSEYVNGAIKFATDENILNDDFVNFQCLGARMSYSPTFNYYHTYWVTYGALVVGPISL